LVGIYFANRKIQRSARFRPHLRNFYDKINKDNKRFEVVVVSLDKKKEDYDFNFQEKSMWYALEFGNPMIKKLDIKYEPPGGFCLCVVQPDGEVIRLEADSDLMRDNKGGKRTFHVWQANATLKAPPKKEAAPAAAAAPAPEEAAPAAEAPVEEVLPVNKEGETIAWTARGAEFILPWPMSRWKCMPVDHAMVTAEQLQLIFETKKLVTKAPVRGAKDPTIEDLIEKLSKDGYIAPMKPEDAFVPPPLSQAPTEGAAAAEEPAAAAPVAAEEDAPKEEGVAAAA